MRTLMFVSTAFLMDAFNADPLWLAALFVGGLFCIIGWCYE